MAAAPRIIKGLLLIFLSTGAHGAGFRSSSNNNVRSVQRLSSGWTRPRVVAPLPQTTTQIQAQKDATQQHQHHQYRAGINPRVDTVTRSNNDKKIVVEKKKNEFGSGLMARVLRAAAVPSTPSAGAMISLLVLASMIHGDPAHAFKIFDNDWTSNFKVDFAGFEVDHRVLVEGVVGGQTIGFIGSLVGGRAAKQRKDEVEKLAGQLKELNIQLRNKARANRRKKKAIEPKDPMHERILGYLRMGKRTLKDQNGAAALSAFQKAMDAIAEAKRAGPYNNPQVERKAYRGLGAASLLLGKYSDALMHMTKVVELSKASGDTSGLGDAYGVIADIYTEMGDFVRAGDYYDLYMKAIVEDDEDETDETTAAESEEGALLESIKQPTNLINQ